MGNTSTKESRATSPPPQGHHYPGHRASRSFSGPSPSPVPLIDGPSTRSSRRHHGRENLEAALLGLNLGSRETHRDRDDGPYKTREERRAEKEAERRKERDKEREKSMAEESIDGGYLVTVGVYVGPEDYSLKVVRQLQIERRLAPFWKGIEDHESDWTDAQLVAAARGLPIPDADAVVPPSPTIASSTTEDLNKLTVPIASRSRSQSYGSDVSPSSSTGRLSTRSLSSSPLAGFTRPRAKTLGFSRSSSANATPVEINIPSRTVNDRPIEAVLYENASECPICFLYYPPYHNRTRCCDQPICSECFVQIKRADPHIPEHSPPGSPPSQPADQDRRAHTGDQLVSEPASCPFCKQPEFGIVYSPPPFKRGLVYAHHSHPYSAQHQSPLSHSVTSSTSSLPGTPGSPRRKTTYAVNAPEVVTTDKIRPDWAAKLAHAKNQAARRAAAATALHTAAYLMHNMNSSGSSSSNPFSSRRILRRTQHSNGSMTPSGGSGSITPAPAISSTNVATVESETPPTNGNPPSGLHQILTARRNRMVDLEEMMLMEAIRLSLAEEEERKKKEAKETKEKKERESSEAAAQERAAFARLATSAPEPSRLSADMGKGKAPANGAAAAAPRLDTTAIRKSTEDQSSPTLGFGTAPHVRMHPSRAQSDVSSSASSVKESSDEEDATEPMFNFQSLAQTLMDAEEEGSGAKGKQPEQVAETAPAAGTSSKKEVLVDTHDIPSISNEMTVKEPIKVGADRADDDLSGSTSGLEESVATLKPRVEEPDTADMKNGSKEAVVRLQETA